ncbi:uncharacterized protein LOC144729443 [Lampetra planeri]
MEEIVPVKPSIRSLKQGFIRQCTETNKRIEELQAIITARSLNKTKLLGTKLPSFKPAQVHSDGNQRSVTQTMHNDNGDAGGGGGGGGCSDDGRAAVTQLGEEVATVETAPDTDRTWERRGTFFVFPQGLRYDPPSCSNWDDASPQETGGDDGDDEDGGGGDVWPRASVDEDEVETTTLEMERTKERRRTMLTLTQPHEHGFRSANWGPRLNIVRLVAAMPTIDSSPTLSEHRPHREAEGPADPPWLTNSTPSSERLGHEDNDSREEAERFASEPAELPNKMVLHLSASEASDDMELAHCPGPAAPKEIPRVEGGGEPAVPPRDPTRRGGASSGDDGADAPGKLSPPEEVVSRSKALLPSLSETLDDAELAHCPSLATPKGIRRGAGGDPVPPDDPTRHAATSSGNGVVDGALVEGGEDEEEVIVCTSEAPLPSPSDDSSQSRSPTPLPVAVGKAHKRKLDQPVVTREGADTAEVKAGPKHSRRQTDKQRGEHGTTAQSTQRRKLGAPVPPATTTSQQSGGGAAPPLGKPRAKRAATTSTIRVTRTLTLQQEAAVTAAAAALATFPTAASTTAAAPAANAALLAAATTAATSPTVAASTNAAAPTPADSPADIVPTAAAAPIAVPGAAAVDKVEAAEPLKEKTPETAMRVVSKRKTRSSATGKDLSGLTGKSSSTTTARSQKKAAATEGKAMAKAKGKPRGRGASQGELEKETTEASGQPENLGICTPPLPPAPPPTPTEIDSPLEGAGAEKTPERRQQSLRARGPQASVKALSPSPGPKPTRRLRSKALATITEGETLKGQEKATGGKGKAAATATAVATAVAKGKAEGKRTTRVAQREPKNEPESVQPKTRRIRALPASSPPTPSESDHPPEAAAAAGTEKKTPQRRQRSLRSQGPQTSAKALSPSPGPKPTLRQRSKALATITDGETLKTDAADGKPNLKKRLGLAPGKGK